MHDIAFFSTPFDLSQREFFSVSVGQTVREALAVHGFLDRMLESAIVVARNGSEITEAQWDAVIAPSDIVTLHLLPQGPAVVAWIAANWIMVAFVAVTALYLANVMEPEIPGVANIPEASPSYSISARGNSARLGSPKPVFYGRVRTWPDLSSLPYTEFEADSDQVLYQLYEVRQGACTIDVADMRIEDTPLADFSDYQVEVIQPGEKSALFPTQIVASNEFSSITFSQGEKTEAEYLQNPAAALTGAYVACDIGQRATRLSVDIIAPGGLYGIRKKNGALSEAFALFFIEAQQIDDANNALGDYFRLTKRVVTAESHPFNDTVEWRASSRDAIRRTFDFSVPLGRYRVRVGMVATGAYGNVNDYDYGNCEFAWAGLRATLEDSLPTTTTTRVALKIRASEQLGGKSLGRFNCISTGKLSTWHPSTGWGAAVVTANPAWVFADVIRNSIYGGARDDAFIDLPGLYALAQQLDTEGIRFDGGFDTATTVWDALTRVAAVAQAVPVDRAGVYYMVRDVQSAPTYMFTHANIVRDSFKISYASVLEETADAVRVNFFDETSDYRSNSLLCKLTGSAALTPRDVTLFGCTNKDRAFKWGMYLAAINHYRRINVEFDTGIEGYLPFFYDTVAVSHYLVGRDSLAQVSGDVVAFDGVDVLTLSEKISGLVSPYIIIRGLNGAPSAPYPITVLDNFRIKIQGGFNASALVFDAGYERPHFMCGEGEHFYALVKINKISAQGDGVYRISGFVDAPEVYTAANGMPTPPVNALPAVVNRAPVVKNLLAAVSGTVSAPLVTLGWSGSYADYYLVDFSVDSGVTWSPLGDGKFLNTFAEHGVGGVVHYRVAGVSILRGDYATLIVDVANSQFLAPEPVTNVRLLEPFVGLRATVLWDSNYNNHHIKIKKLGAVIFEQPISGTQFEITAETAEKYNLGRSFDIQIFSVSANELRSATAPLLSLSNPVPAVPTGIATVAGYSQIHLEWSPSADKDIAGYRVWMSGTSSFSPAPENLIYDGAANKIIIRTLASGAPISAGVNYYLRLAAYDKFGKTELLISNEISASALSVIQGVLAGEIRESQLHSELTTRIDLIDDPVDGLVIKSQQNAQAIAAEAISRAQAVADEATARAQAITAEVNARQSAVSGEANTRATAILAEATARQNAIDTAVQTLTAADQNNAAAIQNEVTARTTAVAAEATQRNTLATQFRGNYTGNDLAGVTSGLLYQEKLQRTTAIDSLTQQTALLSAGANTQFDHVKLWHFDALEGWTGNYATPTLNAGWLRYANGADPYAQVAVNIDGAKYPQIRARIRKIGNPVWRGYVNYSTVNAPTLTHLTAIPVPDFKDGIANLTWNMTGDWLLSNVTAIVISPTYQSATDYCEIDWIAVGRPSPGASSAELFLAQQTLAAADSAMASDIQSMNSALAGKASTSAVDALTARTTAAEGAISSNSAKTTALEARTGSGGNLIPIDTEFSKDASGWETWGQFGQPVTFDRNGPDATWVPRGVNQLRISTVSPINGLISITSPVVPVTVGARYCAAIYVAHYRCYSELRLFFYDINNVYITETAPAVMPSEVHGSYYLQDWARPAVFGVAPAGAAYVRFGIRYIKLGNPADMYGWMCRPMICEVAPAVTVAPPYAPAIPAAAIAGTSTALETLSSEVRNSTTGLAAVAQKAADLQALVGTSQGGAFESLKSKVLNSTTGLDATSDKVVKLTNRLDVKNLNKNTVFTDYWGAWNTGPQINPDGSAYFNVTNAQTAGIRTAIDFPNYAFIDVELTFTLHSGEIYGAGIWFDRYNVQTGQWVGEGVKLSDYYSYGSLVLGKKVTLKLRLKRPANFPHMTQAAYLYVMANQSGLGAMPSKAITFHSCVVTASDKTADALEILNTQVQDTSTGLAATSNKILQLNAQLGMGSAETYNEFKARVTQDQKGRVDALSTQVTALSAVVDGGILSNLWKHDSECNGLGFLPNWGWVKQGQIQGDLVQNYSGTTKPDACGFLGQGINAVAGTLAAVAVYKGDSGYGIPIIAGNSYSFRCKTMTTAGQYFNCWFYFFDAAGSSLGQTSAGGCGASAGGANIENWADLTTVHITAPANAAYLQINVYVMGTNTPAGVFGMTRFQVTSGAAGANPAAYKANQQGTFATISSQLAAQASANSATAGRVDTFKSALQGNAGGTLPAEFAAIQQQFEALNGVSAKWSVKTQVGDLVGGIGLLNKNGRIELAINADRIAFYPPEGVGSSGEQARLFVWDAELGRLVLNQVYVDKIFANEVYANKIFVNATVGGQANFVRANLGTTLIDDIAGSASLTAKVDFVAAGLWGKDLGGGARNMISSLTLGGLVRALGSSLFVSSVNDPVKLYSNAGATVNYDAYISNALVSSYALTWYTPQNPFAGVTLSGQTRAAGETGFRGALGSRTSSSAITATVAVPSQFSSIAIGARVRFFNSTNDYVEGIWGGCSTRMLNLQTGQSTWEAKDYYEISFSDVFGFNFSGFTSSTQLRVYASNSPTLFSYVGQFNNNFVLTRPIVNGEVFFFTTSAAQGQLSAIGVR